jgi:nucleoside 2-deoxyribosyltransferase
MAFKLVYVAGPYRGKTTWDVERNIQRAREVGALVAIAGAMPVIPHSNTSHFDGLATEDFWISGTMEIMRRCDAVLTFGNWPESNGTLSEIAEAQRLEIPVFHMIEDLERWLS